MDFKTIFFNEYNNFKLQSKTRQEAFNNAINECEKELEDILKQICNHLTEQLKYEVDTDKLGYKYIKFHIVSDEGERCQTYSFNEYTASKPLLINSIDSNDVIKSFSHYFLNRVIKPIYKI